MIFSLSIAGILLTQLTTGYAASQDGRIKIPTFRPSIPQVSLAYPDAPVVSRNGTILPSYDTVYEFNQLIDHNNPSLGTFTQRYWHTYELYEPGVYLALHGYYKLTVLRIEGGPIILMTPGEGDASYSTSYLTNQTMNGMIAQQQNGSTIVLEHRFFGLSNPYPDLTEESLKLLTIQQAIDDLVYFAQNVNLPMPGGDHLTPDHAPWIIIGGSYAGALTSWTMANNFWKYFEPIRVNMPQNCSADIQAALSYIDPILFGRNTTAIQEVKENFGLGNLTHIDDFAYALSLTFGFWQDLQVASEGAGSFFYEFCDSLEVKDGVNAPASGWGMPYAYEAWGDYWSQDLYPGYGVDIQVNRTNELYEGWNVKHDRFFFANGMRDPWRDATVSADGVNIQSTDEQPIAVGDGFHTSDLLAASAVDPTVLAVQEKGLSYMKSWLAEWQPRN
ncbi:hypothetical protein H0H92_015482 [Tricholoma furcatifolium]|nr:hypothetical protein H0H92_015482 [Tricholoma furcatifolium]